MSKSRHSNKAAHNSSSFPWLAGPSFYVNPSRDSSQIAAPLPTHHRTTNPRSPLTRPRTTAPSTRDAPVEPGRTPVIPQGHAQGFPVTGGYAQGPSRNPRSAEDGMQLQSVHAPVDSGVGPAGDSMEADPDANLQIPHERTGPIGPAEIIERLMQENRAMREANTERDRRLAELTEKLQEMTDRYEKATARIAVAQLALEGRIVVP